MGALHNLISFGQRHSGLFALTGDPMMAVAAKNDLGAKFVSRETTPSLGPQAVPMPDPQALALEQRRMFARMASAGQGRASTILSQQPSSDRLGP